MTKNKLVSLLSPAAFLLFGIWIKVSTLSMSKRDATFPSLVSYVIIVISVIDLISELRKAEHKDRFKDTSLLRVLACVAAMFLYVFLLKKIGFFLDTVLLGAFIMWVLGYQRYKILVACAVGIAAVVFGVFYGLLNVPLPTLFL